MKAINWQNIKEKIRENENKLEHDVFISQNIEKVFRDRALELRNKKESGLPRAHKTITILEFLVQDEKFCVELKFLKEVIPFERCTALPKSKKELLGVINHRGEIYSIMDLASILKIQKEEKDRSGYVLILKEKKIGFRVNKISELHDIKEDFLSQLKEDSYSCTYCKGYLLNNINMLDIKKILGHPIFSKERAGI